MKKFRSFLFAFVIVLLFSSFSFAETQIRLAVVNTTKDLELASQSEIIANNITGILTKSAAISVAERDKLELVMRERASDSFASIGEIMGCQYMILSSIVNEDSPVISVRIVEVATSEIVFSNTEIPDTFDDSAILAASSRLADEVLEALAGEQAVVTEIHERDIIINRGSSSGVRAGDLYRVYMGTKRNSVNLAIIRVTDVHVGFSTAEVVKNGGYIDLIRRVDKIEAISKDDANKLIKRKKFAKNRPGENDADLVNAPLRQFSKSIENYAKTLEHSRDIILKKSQPAIDAIQNGKDFPSQDYYNLGLEWNKLAQEISRDKTMDEFYKKFDLMYVDKSSEQAQKVVKAFQNIRPAIEKSVNANFEVAVFCFTEAAKKGHVKAQSQLGYMYSQGLGVQQDLTQAVEWYTKAAEQGNITSQFNLGYMYSNGRGVTQDYAKAFEWYSKAAEQGYASAQYNLGYAYEKGQGVKQNYEKAVELYTKAAQQKHVLAQSRLAYMYEHGYGVKQDYKKAFEWYSRSAEQGNGIAMNNLARLYENGYGVPQNVKKAIELYRKAAAHGSKTAPENLKRLGAN